MDWHPLPLADENEVSQAFSGSLSQLTEHFAAVNVSKISPTVSSTDTTRHDLRVAKQSYLPPSVGDCSSTPQKSTSLRSSLPSSSTASAKETNSISNVSPEGAHNLQHSSLTSVDSSSRTISTAPDRNRTTLSLPSEATHSTTSLSSSKADLGAGDSSQEPSDGRSGLPPDLSVGDITGSTTPGVGANTSPKTNDSTPDFIPLHGFVPATHSSRQWFQQERQVTLTAQYEDSSGRRQALQTKGVVSGKKERQGAFSERAMSKNNPQALPRSAIAQSAPMKHFGSGPRQHGLHDPSPVLPSLSELRKGPQFVQFFLPKKTESEHSTSTSELSSTLQAGNDSSAITHTFPSSVDTHSLPLHKDTAVGAHTLHSARDPSSNTFTSTDIPSHEATSEESTHGVAETLEAEEDPPVNVSSSTHTLSKEATSEESTHEVIETLATEAVRKARSKPTQVVPGRDLTHLDRLWEALLKSPYATTRALHQHASRGDADGIVGRAFQQDSQSVLRMLEGLDVSESAVLPELDRIKCTCGAHERQRAAERPHLAAHRPGYGAKSTRALRMQARPTQPLEKDGSSPSLRQAPPPEANARHVAPRHEAVRKRAKNQGVQTSPSLFQCGAPGQENRFQTPDRWAQLPGAATRMTASESKAVSFTVSHTSPLQHESSSSTLTSSPHLHHAKEGHSISASSFDSSLAEPSQPHLRTLAPLSLQEACQMYKKAFINHSQQRQLLLQCARKQRDELDQLSIGIHGGGPASIRGGEKSVLYPTTPQAQTIVAKETTRVLAPSWIPAPGRKLGKELQAEMKAKARRYKSTHYAGVG